MPTEKPAASLSAISVDVQLDHLVDRLTSEFPVCYLLDAIADNLEQNAPEEDDNGKQMIAAVREAARKCRVFEE